jgi:hypothetical protein
MCADILLGCSAAASGRIAIGLLEPEMLDPPSAGVLLDPPSAWTSKPRLFGDMNELSGWVRGSVGRRLADEIASVATAADEPSRLLLYSAPRILMEAHGVPWELLEKWGPEYAIDALSVIRIFEREANERPPSAIGERLRILVTWADPRDDIVGLQAHLSALEDFRKQNDFRVAMRQVELTGEHVLDKLGFEADVVYHISHGAQRAAGQPVVLQAGPRGKPFDLPIATFATMLRHVGEPRLVVLNACESFTGSDWNIYMGAAPQLVPAVDAIVSMQTQVPVLAAIRFANQLFRSLADGRGLAASVRFARTAMVRWRYVKRENLPPFTRFIPVVLQRSRQDKLFSVDLPSRDRSRILTKLLFHTELTEPLLRRDAEGLIADLLTGRDEHRVSLIRGPQWSGKSTTVQAIIRRLSDGSAPALRPLYYSLRKETLTEDVAEQVRHVLRGVASTFDWMTHELFEALKEEIANADEAVGILANWLRKQEEAGLRFAVVLDDLPPALAARLADAALRVIAHGHLMLVTRDGQAGSGIPLRIVELGPLSAEELAHSLPETSQGEIETLIARSNGMPFFILTARQRRDSDSSAAEYVDNHLDLLSDDALATLYRCALCDEPLPPEILGGGAAALAEELRATLLVRKTAAGAYLVPEQIRPLILETIASDFELGLRDELLASFADLAEAQVDRQRIVACYQEAFRQAMQLIDRLAEGRESVFAAASKIAGNLTYEYLERDHQPEAAKACWERYLDAAEKAGIPDRMADARYAQTLVRLGASETADDVLRELTRNDEADAVQVGLLLLRDEVLKDLGISGTWETRLEVLQRALVTVEKVAPSAERELQRARVEHALGNMLGYGIHARPAEAIRHLESAAAIFDEAGDIHAYRTLSEILEVRRYNDMLTPAERAEAIEAVRARAEELDMLGERYDTIQHLYELGRLTEAPAAKAEWYRRAFERAGNSYAPLNWHAGIRWRMNQVDGGSGAFDDVAADLVRYCDELSKWQQRAWSRRVLREALRFLYIHFGRSGRTEQQRRAAARCWRTVRLIHERGEGRRDEAERAAIAREVAPWIESDELLKSSLEQKGENP